MLMIPIASRALMKNPDVKVPGWSENVAVVSSRSSIGTADSSGLYVRGAVGALNGCAEDVNVVEG